MEYYLHTQFILEANIHNIMKNLCALPVKNLHSLSYPLVAVVVS